LGIGLIVLDQAIDTTTPSGRLLFHVLGAIAEFERDLIRERTAAGMRAARRRGKRIGRPRAQVSVSEAQVLLARGRSISAVARELCVSRATLQRRLKKVSQGASESP
jgi:DNA invertase Pin-like site-specific DNA recombinase